uniref:Uncharacterized protein n=1 Tax=viral metagenome TaxID=1070528 RepID=A0A6C0F5T4_9ZZZZ
MRLKRSWGYISFPDQNKIKNKKRKTKEIKKEKQKK